MSFTFYKQRDQMDCGSTCLRMIAKSFGRHYSSETLRKKAQVSREGVSLLGISEAAEQIGLRSMGLKISLKKLISYSPLPCILHWGQDHFVVLYDIRTSKLKLPKRLLANIWGGKAPTFRQDLMFETKDELALGHEILRDKTTTFLIADPAKGLLEIGLEDFIEKWVADSGEGVVLVLETTPRFYLGVDEDEVLPNKLRFGHLMSYLGRFKRLILQLVFGMVVGSILSLILPFLIQSVVDVGIASQNMPFIYLVLFAQMALLLSTAFIDFLRSWILLHINTRLNLTIISEFIAKLTRLPISFFAIRHLGDIIQRVGDHSRIESFLTGQSLTMVFSFLNLLMSGFILAYFHLTIFIIALSASLLYCLWVVVFLKRRARLDTRKFEISAHNQSLLVQLVQSMRDIKLSGAETSKRWEWERNQAKLFRWSVRSLSLSQYQQFGGVLINQGKNIFISFLAAKSVVDGNLTIGAMISIQYIMAQFNAPIEQLVGFLQSWQDAHISLERLNEVHGMADEDPVDGGARSDWEPGLDIMFQDVSYTYPGAGNEPVLRKINLIIPNGKTTAIVGTSGSGKTTLLKLLLRFYDAQHGKILLMSKAEDFVDFGGSRAGSFETSYIGGDLDVRHISHKAWRKRCGVVMQDGFIFSDTVARNIAVNEDVIDVPRLHHAARVANIHQFIESLPLGYSTKIGAEGSGVSQGQRQRILIARSVYKDPQLILFDEATNSMDANNESIIMQNLVDFFRGRTVVVVAHRLSTVKNADQIIVLEKGEIAESGTHDQLLNKRGKYYELVSNQIELSTQR